MTRVEAAAIAVAFAVVAFAGILAVAFAVDSLAPASTEPTCHAYCDVITRGALLRQEGPLPHDCRFFTDCGCAYQCAGMRR